MQSKPRKLYSKSVPARENRYKVKAEEKNKKKCFLPSLPRNKYNNDAISYGKIKLSSEYLQLNVFFILFYFAFEIAKFKCTISFYTDFISQ